LYNLCFFSPGYPSSRKHRCFIIFPLLSLLSSPLLFSILVLLDFVVFFKYKDYALLKRLRGLLRINLYFSCYGIGRRENKKRALKSIVVERIIINSYFLSGIRVSGEKRIILKYSINSNRLSSRASTAFNWRNYREVFARARHL
jgi:hypothetical protein